MSTLTASVNGNVVHEWRVDTPSNQYWRVPMTVNVRGVVSGGHVRDRVATWRWLVNGQPVTSLDNRSVGVFSLANSNPMVVQLDVVTRMGARVSRNITLTGVANQPPTCTLNGSKAGVDVVVNASCNDPDGRVVDYRWNIRHPVHLQ